MPSRSKMIRLPLLMLLCISAGATAQAETESDGWEFTLTPYLWAAGVKGSSSADGSDPPPINPDYNFFSFDNLDGVAFLQFDARKGQWLIHTDIIYVAFEDNFDVGPVNTNIDLAGSSIEFSAGFRPADWRNTELIIGLRGLNLDVGIVLEPGSDGRDERTWVDPIIGIQHSQPIGDRWRLLGRLDVGGFGVASNSTLNAFVGTGYQFNNTFSLLFGYRYLSFKFEDEGFFADLEILGYGLGFEFNF